MSLNDPMSGAAVVGVTGEGVGGSDGDGRGLGLVECVGSSFVALFWPVQPVVRRSTASNEVVERANKG